MYRLFSDFPPGLPGVGLLLLRVALAGFLALEGTAVGRDLILIGAASRPDQDQVAYGLTLVALSLLVAAGVLTPIVQVIVVLVESTVLVMRLQAVGADLLTIAEWQRPVLPMAIAFALALLGPGAYSVDGRLFGRREIVVPRANESRKRSSATRK